MLWLDGNRIEGTSTQFDLRDRGLLLGDGVFDTSLVINGKVVFAREHMDRLAGSCAAFDIPFDRASVEATASEAAKEIGTGTLRITVTRGPAPRQIVPPSQATPYVIVSAQAGVPNTMWRPIRLSRTEIRRNETSPTSHHKCIAYLDSIIALDRAARNNADEVIFQNTTGRIACCATGNLFIISGDTLKTPPLADGCLAGIIRGKILDFASAAGLTAMEDHLDIYDLTRADGIFMTNSLRLISPVVAVGTKRDSTMNTDVIRVLAKFLSTRIQEHHGICPRIEIGI